MGVSECGVRKQRATRSANCLYVNKKKDRESQNEPSLLLTLGATERGYFVVEYSYSENAETPNRFEDASNRLGYLTYGIISVMNFSTTDNWV